MNQPLPPAPETDEVKNVQFNSHVTHLQRAGSVTHSCFPSDFLLVIQLCVILPVVTKYPNN